VNEFERAGIHVLKSIADMKNEGKRQQEFQLLVCVLDRLKELVKFGKENPSEFLYQFS